MKHITELQNTWNYALTAAKANKDKQTLLAMGLEISRVMTDMELAEYDQKPGLLHDIFAAIGEDLTTLMAEVDEALDLVGRPKWNEPTQPQARAAQPVTDEDIHAATFRLIGMIRQKDKQARP